jgi:hypothetical protein
MKPPKSWKMDQAWNFGWKYRDGLPEPQCLTAKHTIGSWFWDEASIIFTQNTIFLSESISLRWHYHYTTQGIRDKFTYRVERFVYNFLREDYFITCAMGLGTYCICMDYMNVD